MSSQSTRATLGRNSESAIVLGESLGARARSHGYRDARVLEDLLQLAGLKMRQAYRFPEARNKFHVNSIPGI